MLNIIIPVYHSTLTLKDTLNSCLSQTNHRFSITICNDGDLENSEFYKQTIEQYKKMGLHIFYLENSINQGPGLARQLGIDYTNFEYLMFLDSDDILCPRAVEILSREILINDCDVVIGDFYIEHQDHTISYVDSDKVPCQWLHGKIYKKSFLVDNNIRFHPFLRVNEDSYFNLIAINCAKKKAKVHEGFMIWRNNTRSLSRQKNYSQIGTLDYLVGQIDALYEIYRIDHDMEINAFAGTIYNIYSYMQRAEHDNIDISNISSNVTKLLRWSFTKTQMQKPEFWKQIYNSYKGMYADDENIYWYKQNFIDWYNYFLGVE